MIFKVDWEKTDTIHKLPTGMVEKMAHCAYPNKILQSYNLISGGCANLNFKIQFENESNLYILRVYLRDKEAVHKEQSLYKLLKDTVPVPQIYFVGSIDNYQFAIVEFINGITLRDLLLGNETYDLDTIMYGTGKILAKIAMIEFPKAGFFDKDLNIISEHVQDDYLNFVKESLKNQIILEQLGPDLIAKINFCLQKYEFPSKNERHLVHADFDPANILVDKIDGNWKITAILDWEFSFSGSMLCDVANMLRYKHLMPPEFEESFIKGLKAGGVVLPKNWREFIHMLNLLSLLDCLGRSDPENRPNQLTDIKNLIEHILAELDSSLSLIEVVPYNENWPKAFAKEAEKIREALGDNCIEIHHIGSTSVPGLAAKPLIDILPVVKDIHLVNEAISDMQKIGYEAKGEFGIPFRYFFTKSIGTSRTHNVHAFEKGNSEIERHLNFRNWMRNKEDDRNAYALLKIKLAAEYPNDIYYYCCGKDNFVNEIDRKAGWNGYRFVMAATPKEWQEYHRIRREQIFEPLNIIYDENHPTITASNHYHFVLYKGLNIVSVAHVEFINESEVAIRSLATDKPYKMKGYAKHMMQLLEKWIKLKGKNIIKLHANPAAENFYRKLGYDTMEFDDVSISKDTIDLGKIL